MPDGLRPCSATDTGAEVEARIAEYVPAGADDVVIVPSATDDDPAGGRTLKLATEIANRLQ